MASTETCKDFAIVIPLTRGLHATIDLEDYALVSQFKWRAIKGSHLWYAYGYLLNNEAEAMHRIIIGAVRGQEVDHRNGDTLDNRRGNLRVATRNQNMANRPRKKGAIFKGVKRNSSATLKHVWSASITISRKNIHIDCYGTPEEAARAYDAKAREAFGEFACVNFPREGERQA